MSNGTVAVIGTGASGLTAVKSCMEEASFQSALRSWIVHVSGDFGLTRSTASASIVVRSPTRVRR